MIVPALVQFMVELSSLPASPRDAVNRVRRRREVQSVRVIGRLPHRPLPSGSLPYRLTSR